MKKSPDEEAVRLTRRQVLRFGGAAALSAALAGCAPQPGPAAPPAAPTTAPAVAPTAAATKAPVATKPLPVSAYAMPTPTNVAPGTACQPNSGLDAIKKLSESKVELKGWAPNFNPNVPEMTSWNQQVFFQKMEELTNIKVNWSHGSPDPQVNALSLVMASGDLPDFIVMPYADMNTYVLEGALEPIDPYFDKLVWLPKLMKERPDLRAYMTAVDGKMYHFPRCQQDQRMQAHSGMGIRKDWLDEAKLPIPTTMDQYYEALKAFKKADPKRIPLSGDPRMLIWQWGVGSACIYGNTIADYFQDNGKVKYGPLEPGWKEAMIYLNKLFKEELLDPEFMTKGTERVGQDILGAAFEEQAIPWQAKQSEYDAQPGNTKQWVAMHPPKGPYGHMQNHTTQSVSNFATGGVISKTCKNKELLARYIDQYYSPSGSQLMFWGVCNDTWSYDKDGKMQYSGRYVGAKVQGAAFVRNFLGPQAYGPMLVNGTALAAWSGGYGGITVARRLFWAEEPNDLLLPDCIPLKKAENNDYRAKMGDINTLLAEHWPQFINGKKNLTSDYDSFIAKLKSLGIADAISILQVGYDRFLASLKAK